MPGERFVPVVGLVGGIGSGKSVVARWVSERADVAIVDGDLAGHEALRSEDVRQRVGERFPDCLTAETETIDRAILARRVFGADPVHQRAREDLESIVHPVIRRSLENSIDRYRSDQRQPGAVDAVLLDAAVLLEAGWRDLCDHVVFVDVPGRLRLERITATRDWDRSVFASRESAQWPLEQKRQAADTVLDNSGPLDGAGRRLLELIHSLTDAGSCPGDASESSR